MRIFAGPMTLTLPDGGLAYSLQPATSPNAGYETANNGTEYFLSGTDWGVAPRRPLGRPPSAGRHWEKVRRRDRLGGLIHEYYRAAA